VENNTLSGEGLVTVTYCRFLLSTWLEADIRLTKCSLPTGGGDIAGNFACPLVVEMLRRTGERRLAKFLEA